MTVFTFYELWYFLIHYQVGSISVYDVHALATIAINDYIPQKIIGTYPAHILAQ